MTQDLGFGLVGCGRIGERHADLLSSGSIAGGRRAAVYDTAPGRVAAFARSHRSPDSPRVIWEESAANLAASREIMRGRFDAKVNDLQFIERLPTLAVL